MDEPITRYLLAATLTLLFSIAAFAQSEVRGVACGVEREVSAGALGEATFNRLSGIYDDIAEERFDQAYPALESLLTRGRRSDYELAVIHQAMGHVRMQQDRADDAISHFGQAVEYDTLPDGQHFEMILIIAHLHYGEERFRAALDQLDFWFCVVPGDQRQVVDVWVMKASIHAQIEEFREALAAVDRAIDLADEPREQWLQLKLGMHLELNEYREAVDVLKQLIQIKPDNKTYWVQLSALYVELGDEPQSKSVLKLAFRRGLLDRQTEYLQLASLLQAEGAPRRAAEVMEDGLQGGIIEDNRRNWEMAAGAWYQARELERALIAYERAGRQSDDGKIDMQRAFLLTNLERWEEAEAALRRAMDLGGLSDVEMGNALLLLGTAHFNLGDLDRSLEVFDQATRYARVSQAAREWINHVREARGRRSSL